MMFFSEELLKQAIDLIEREKPEAFLTAVEVEKYFPGGYLVLENNFVKQIIEKTRSRQDAGNLFNLVFDYYRDPALLFLPSGNLP